MAVTIHTTVSGSHDSGWVTDDLIESDFTSTKTRVEAFYNETSAETPSFYSLMFYSRQENVREKNKNSLEGNFYCQQIQFFQLRRIFSKSMCIFFLNANSYRPNSGINRSSRKLKFQKILRICCHSNCLWRLTVILNQAVNVYSNPAKVLVWLWLAFSFCAF